MQVNRDVERLMKESITLLTNGMRSSRDDIGTLVEKSEGVLLCSYMSVLRLIYLKFPASDSACKVTDILFRQGASVRGCVSCLTMPLS